MMLDKDDSQERLMKALDKMGDIQAVLTGMRQNFIDAGWSEDGAEAMVIEIFRS